MALTRSFLSGMGLSADQISAIIEAHTDTVDALKAQRDGFKADAESLKDVQKQLDDLKAKGDGGWQKKFEDEHSAFEAFKAETTAKETAANTKAAYESLLREAGVADKYIKSVMRASDLSGVKLGKDGKIEGADKLTESVKQDFGDFIAKASTKGADVPTPPAGGGKTYTAQDIRSMSAAEINANWSAVKQALASESK